MVVVNTSYPGVYVAEVPSGTRSITGVATSVTAFVGPTTRGPVHQAVTVDSYAGYERTFGGLGTPVGFAVRDYFANGGGQAVVVRVVSATAETAEFHQAGLPTGQTGLVLRAADPGPWADRLRIDVDHDVVDPTSTTLFNLTVTDPATSKQEAYRNLTTTAGPRFVVDVLAAGSALVRVVPPAGDTAIPRPLVTGPDTAFAVATPTSVGAALGKDDYDGEGFADRHHGIRALDLADPFTLLCVPPTDPAKAVDAKVMGAAAQLCVRRRAVLIVDLPGGVAPAGVPNALAAAGVTGEAARNAAVFYPKLLQRDPTADGRSGEFASCGAVAGVIARTDATRGVWKAPAGVDAALAGGTSLAVTLTDEENGRLNALGVNCLRAFPGTGPVVWGARTMRGSDQLGDEYKYLPVRRLALYLESSLFRGTQWAVFEPNDEPLWSQLRLAIGSFMQGLFRQGAFQGTTPAEAFFVRCDKDTTTPDDVAAGRVNVLVGFAPVRPAEFVVLQIQQTTATQA
ncbi:phage tail sheath subtilisin-like domain-containing protein [Amycolatopsis sp. NBC_00355]|uniref:phage tail sheath family protein n=1 Tax=Amycolatopsis sp. NBC_00355 TaxID=2975957 RepID=UPI002E254C32